MVQKTALLIFIKNPIAGKVKTRLATAIGNKKALQIYQFLLERTFHTTQPVACDKFVFYSDSIDDKDHWQQNGYHQKLQKGNTLGERMEQAFSDIFDHHYNKAVIIGSDCYDITSQILEDAYAALNDHDVVIGPARDGGYYLLGLKKLYPELFRNKQWSTGSVLADTINDAKQLHLKYTLLPALSDIDEPKDLQLLPLEKFNLR